MLFLGSEILARYGEKIVGKTFFFFKYIAWDSLYSKTLLNGPPLILKALQDILNTNFLASLIFEIWDDLFSE